MEKKNGTDLWNKILGCEPTTFRVGGERSPDIAKGAVSAVPEK